MQNIKNKCVSEYEKLQDECSETIFNKPVQVLTISEINTLNSYVHDMSNPEWKEIFIDGISTGYYVSNVGTVKDCENNLLKQYMSTYPRVYLKQFGTVPVHRLVAEAFIPNPDNKPQVNHINGNKECNWVGNLEWVTAKENAWHAIRTGLVNNNGENQVNHIYSTAQIETVCRLIEEGKSNSEISRLTLVNSKTVSDIRNRKAWKIISANFKFPKPIGPKYRDSKIVEVCTMLENPNITQTEISRMTGVDIDCIKDIMKGSRYRRISSNYNLQQRSHSGECSGVSKYTAPQIIHVCDLLSQDTKSIKEISLYTGVQLSTVYDLLHKKKWKFISEKYDFTNRRNN